MSTRIVIMLSAVCVTLFVASAQIVPAFPGLDPAVTDDLVAANRILAHERVLDGYGHVSVRDPRNPGHYLMSRSLAPALVTAADIMEYDLDSNPIDAHGRTSYKERFIHGEIYKARPDVMAIIHSHSPTIVPFSVSKTPLRAILHNAGFLGAGPPVFDIRDIADNTTLLVETPAFGRALAQKLGNGDIVLMRGHGDTVAAANVRLATYMAIYAEIDARELAVALALGGPVTYLDDGEVKATVANMRNHAYERPWQLWKRDAMGK